MPKLLSRPLSVWALSLCVIGAGAHAQAPTPSACLSGGASSAVQSLCTMLNGFARIQVGGRWGFVDKGGRMAIAPQFDDAGDFNDDRALIKQGGLYGYINEKGEITVPPRFVAARSFSFNRASVTVDGKQGFIDPSGKLVVEPAYADTTRFTGPVALVRETDGTQALIDDTGQTLKRFPRDVVVSPANDFGLFPAEQNGLRGLIRGDGEWAIPPVAHALPGTQAKPYIALGEGAERRVMDIRGRVSTAAKPIGLMEDWPDWWWPRVETNPKGETVTVFSGFDFKERVRVPGKVAEGAQFKEGVLIFEPNPRTAKARWGLVNHLGKVLGTYPFELIQPMRENAGVVGQRLPAPKGEPADAGAWRYGYLDREGRRLTPLKFDAAQDFSEQYAVVAEAGQIAMIDDQGRVTLRGGWACGDRMPLLLDGKKRVVWPADARKKRVCG